MTKDKYLSKFKRNLESIIDDANVALEEIREFEEYDGDFDKLRDEIECIAMSLSETASDLDRMSLEDVEDEE